jgi:hypothetical protein
LSRQNPLAVEPFFSGLGDRSLRGTALVIVVLTLLLAAASVVAYWSWQELAEVEIGFHGYVALGLGVGLTILLWVGLMSLVFFSSRRGYDDEAGRD